MTRFRHLIWLIMAAMGLMLSASHSYAQQPDVGDQPGLLADDSVELDPEYRKQMVYYRTTEAPGTIIISTAERHLYLIQPGGRAIRYGIGVGRDGFQWQGLLNITRHEEWTGRGPPPEESLRHRRRPGGISMAGPVEPPPQGGVAGLGAAAGNDRAPALSAALHGRRAGQSARGPRPVSRHPRLSHSR